MQTLPLRSPDDSRVLGAFRNVSDWKEIGPFCVDGRDGTATFAEKEAKEHLYVQALGGSLLFVVMQYVLHPNQSFSESRSRTLQQLKNNGYGCGVHRGSHCSDVASDCGFADNLGEILKRLVDEERTIANLLSKIANELFDEAVWSEVISDVDKRVQDELDLGEQMVADSMNEGANLQTLEGDHAEIAATVNLRRGTTLDTRSLVEGGLQAFNLDLWYVLDVAEALRIDQSYATHLALGLYIATEMVLVEDRKNIRLPVLVNT